MTRKQIILGLALACMIYSCDKDEPIIKRQPVEETVPPTDNPEKKDAVPEPSPSDNASSNQEGDMADTDVQDDNNRDNKQEDKQDDTQNTQQASLIEDEVMLYFDLKKSLTVAQAAERINHIRGEKRVADKQISIEHVVLSLEEEQGRLTLQLKGRMDNQTLDQTMTLEGFVKKPSRYNIGKRMQVRWSVSPEEYIEHIDFDALYIDGDASKITSKSLAPLVEFYSTDFDGKPYSLSTQEEERIVLLDVRYRGGKIEFSTQYEGVTSQSRLSLSFDMRAYYDYKVSVNNAPTKQWYMYGIGEGDNISAFLGDLLEYDTQRYAAIYKRSNPNNSDNSIAVDFTLESIETGRELAHLTKTIKGFKPLTDLSKDLTIAGSYDLMTYFQARFKNLEGEPLSRRLRASIQTWLPKAQFFYGSKKLLWERMDVPGGSIMTLDGRDGSRSNQHLLFADPRFEFVKAVRQGRELAITVQLNFVNETSVEGLLYTFTVVM